MTDRSQFARRLYDEMRATATIDEDGRTVGVDLPKIINKGHLISIADIEKLEQEIEEDERTEGVDLQPLPEELHVSTGESLHASIMRSMGARLPDVATMFGNPVLNPNHALLRGEWPYIADGMFVLQDAINMLTADAHALLGQYGRDIKDEQLSNVVIARAGLLWLISWLQQHEGHEEEFGPVTAEDLFEYVDGLSRRLPLSYLVGYEMHEGGGVRADAVWKYRDTLPYDRQVEMVDHCSPWSVLMALCGIPAPELVQFNIKRGRAGTIANGRCPMNNGAAEMFVCDETMALARVLIPIERIVLGVADEAQIQAIYDLTPAQLATAWQLFPTARNALEKHSPYLVTLRDRS